MTTRYEGAAGMREWSGNRRRGGKGMLAWALLVLAGWAPVAAAAPAPPAAPAPGARPVGGRPAGGTESAASRRRGVLVIGVTLHPYYSWTRNVVGNLPGFEVRPILPGEIDAGDYQPRPEDIRKLADLDAIVVNGIGHDDFIFPMLRASGNRRVVIIRPNDATPQIRSAHGTAVNSHTFISFTNAVQQTYAIERALAALRPDSAAALLANAEAYARRLRQIKARAATRLAGARITRVVTVHDGYGYLLQELGLEVAGVVQPAHGLTPSAAELRDMVQLLRREHSLVVFSEETFPEPLLAVLRDEAGVRVYTISHIASGAYTADKFEREMQKNVDTMIEALVTAPPKGTPSKAVPPKGTPSKAVSPKGTPSKAVPPDIAPPHG
ncbi:MAG TPA: zinc ABC transporter substrate-binding protein [Thermoanaerobaculia bacterium]|nr:zinc ABC transporter substrate-binding protein [Thermoanaerobaculia bacterium]